NVIPATCVVANVNGYGWPTDGDRAVKLLFEVSGPGLQIGKIGSLPASLPALLFIGFKTQGFPENANVLRVMPFYDQYFTAMRKPQPVVCQVFKLMGCGNVDDTFQFHGRLGYCIVFRVDIQYAAHTAAARLIG